MDDTQVIDKIDRGLAAYYQSLGRTYYTDNVGKFKKYCEEELGNEWCVVEEELAEDFDPQDSLLVEFDPDFPLAMSRKSPDLAEEKIDGDAELERAKKILSIIRCIHQCGQYSQTKSRLDALVHFDVTQVSDLSFWEVTRMYEEVTKMYQAQCPLWFRDAIRKNKRAISLLAFSHSTEFSKGFPFFTNIVDCFARWHAIRVSGGLEYSIAEWCRDTEYVRRKKNDERTIAFLKSAIDEYYWRGMPTIRLKPFIEINDSLLVIARYLSSISRFIQSTASDANNPFQCDVCFGVNAKFLNRQLGPSHFGFAEDTEDESGDESDEDPEDSHDNNAQDYIGDLHDKLRHEQLTFVHKAVPPNMYGTDQHISNEAFAKSDECRRLTDEIAIFDDDFVSFYNEMHPQNPIGADSQPNPRSKASTDGERMTQLFEEAFMEFKQKQSLRDRNAYPKQRRFCVFVDRRKPHRNVQSTDGDEITIFEPPSDCDSVPENCVEECFLETVQRCIIPHRGYGEELRKGTLRNQPPNHPKRPKNDQTITGLSAMDGTLLTFSFQVMSSSHIVCRLYWNGESRRFMATDIAGLLPVLFGQRMPGAPAPTQKMPKQIATVQEAKSAAAKKIELVECQMAEALKKKDADIPTSLDGKAKDQSTQPKVEQAIVKPPPKRDSSAQIEIESRKSSAQREIESVSYDRDQKKEEWQVGSDCLVFSRSSNQWFEAKIADIFFMGDRRRSNEWLVVEYAEGKKTKQMQRNCADIRPIPKDHVLSLKIGAKCLVLGADTQRDVWLRGSVIAVYENGQGEWLRVKYFERGLWRTCEIQRYSEQLRVYREE